MPEAKDVATDTCGAAWNKQIGSLAVILREEFGVPFRFITQSGAAEAPRVRALEGFCYEMVLPFAPPGPPAPVAVAVGVVAGAARSPADAALEQVRIGKWVTAVHSRLVSTLRSGEPSRHRRASGQGAPLLVGLEALMGLEHLLRTQRIDGTAERNLSQILQVASRILRARTLLWVPLEGEEAEIEGESIVSSWDAWHLARLLAEDPDGARLGYVRNNDFQASTWGGRFPRLTTLLAVPVPIRSAPSWVIALNKSTSPTAFEPGSSHGSSGPTAHGQPAFRRSDAALLLPFAALLGLHLRATRRHQQHKELVVGLIRSLAAAIDGRESRAAGHSERVARVAVELARELGLPRNELGDVYLGGLLHDLGTTFTGADHWLAAFHPIARLLPTVLHHREHYDGTGHPDGLKGDAIPLLARILAVADAYDVATSSVGHQRNAETPRATVEEIFARGTDRQWDGRVIAALFRCRERIRAAEHNSPDGSPDAALRLALA
jgi:hypothetical protein